MNHPNIQRSQIEKQVGAPVCALPGPGIPRGAATKTGRRGSRLFFRADAWYVIAARAALVRGFAGL